MSVLDFLDPTMFDSAYGNILPLLDCESVHAICRELQYAIRDEQQVFVYGDYDMDGFCSMLVWREVFAMLNAKPPVFFKYSSRTHLLDRDIIRQVGASSCKLVLICDTGSSIEDYGILNILKLYGYLPAVIDHHVYYSDYGKDKHSTLMFNSYEERALFGGHEVSGAYASLLVANVLCEKYMGVSIPFGAKVAALASMYADVVDMSTPVARALYNSTVYPPLTAPLLFSGLNKYNYWIGRRLFSYIISPKINGCFRTGSFDLLNSCVAESDKYKLNNLVEQLVTVHSDSRKFTRSLLPLFSQEVVGDFMVFCYDNSTDAGVVRNFTGVVATMLAKQELRAVVVLVKLDKMYVGSVRDYYQRDLLSSFKLFCDAGGHPPSFGISFQDMTEFKRHLQHLNSNNVVGSGKSYTSLSSGLLSDIGDIRALALYNEYMNVRPTVVLSHTCNGVKLLRKTNYNYYYDVGLPGGMSVMTSRRLADNVQVMLEPVICRGVELREMV